MSCRSAAEVKVISGFIAAESSTERQRGGLARRGRFPHNGAQRSAKLPPMAESRTVDTLPRLPLEGNLDLTCRCDNRSRHYWASLQARFHQQGCERPEAARERD